LWTGREITKEEVERVVREQFEFAGSENFQMGENGENLALSSDMSQDENEYFITEGNETK
jgi:hypothetical protein